MEFWIRSWTLISESFPNSLYTNQRLWHCLLFCVEYIVLYDTYNVPVNLRLWSCLYASKFCVCILKVQRFLARSQNYVKRILTLPWLCVRLSLSVFPSLRLPACLSVCLYVCMFIFMYVFLTFFPHKITRFPQKGFYIFLFEDISKSYYENSTFINPYPANVENMVSS